MLKSTKHWCVLYDFDGRYFYISDPVIGVYKTDFDNLKRLTRERNFLYILINENEPIKKHHNKHVENVDIFNILDKESMKLKMDSNILFNKKEGSDYIFKLDNRKNGDDFQLFAENEKRKKYLKIKIF